MRKLFHISTLLLIIFSLYPGSILGFFFYGDFDSNVILISEDDAVLIAKQNLDRDNSTFKHIEQMYYIEKNYAHLCYFIDAVAYDEAYTYVVSAKSGQILNRFSLVQTDGPIIGSGENLLGEWVEGLQVYEGNIGIQKFI